MTNWKNTEIGVIPVEWQLKKIGEIADVTKLAGYEYTKYFKYVDDGEVIALRALNLREGVLDLSNIKRIKKSVSNELPRSKLYIGDILFTYVGANIGQFALVDKNDMYHLAPNICRIRVKENYLPYFIYSYFRTNYFKESLVNYSVGSSQPTMPMGNVRQILIPFPSLSEQESIAKIISSLDDKIDLLHRQNKTLEALAETLFRQWFIEEADESWEKGILGDWIESANTGLDAIKRAPIVINDTGIKCLRIQDVSQKKPFEKWGFTEVEDNNFKRFQLTKGDIIMARTCTPGIIYFVRENLNSVFNNGLVRIRANKAKIYPIFLNYLFKTRDFIGHIDGISGGTSVQLNMQIRDLLSYPFSFPNIEHQNEIIESFLEIDEKLSHNFSQIRTLTQLRDTLLPKLMSGEVRVEG